jgi:hypothetical protein
LKELQETWEWKAYHNIQWLNVPEKRYKGSPWDVALHNTPWVEFETITEEFYSHVVLLIRVPKFGKRNITVNA